MRNANRIILIYTYNIYICIYYILALPKTRSTKDLRFLLNVSDGPPCKRARIDEVACKQVTGTSTSTNQPRILTDTKSIGNGLQLFPGEGPKSSQIDKQPAAKGLPTSLRSSSKSSHTSLQTSASAQHSSIVVKTIFGTNKTRSTDSKSRSIGLKDPLNSRSQSKEAPTALKSRTSCETSVQALGSNPHQTATSYCSSRTTKPSNQNAGDISASASVKLLSLNSPVALRQSQNLR